MEPDELQCEVSDLGGTEYDSDPEPDQQEVMVIGPDRDSSPKSSTPTSSGEEVWGPEWSSVPLTFESAKEPSEGSGFQKKNACLSSDRNFGTSWAQSWSAMPACSKSHEFRKSKKIKNFQKPKTSSISISEKSQKPKNISFPAFNSVPSSSKESHEFEVESYDFDIELDFELMGLDEARDEEDDDPAPELEDLLKKFESKANVVADDFEIVNLGTPEIPREVRIGKSLPPEMKQKMIEFLAPRLSNFAFSYEDMPGLDEELVVHHLPTKADMKPVKQKLRRMKPEWALKVRDEVIKQYNAGFLVVSNYPEWLANIVPVPKKDGKVRMCIDFRDLNKASPKDDFPLPHIDTLVDNTAGYKIFSFMDGFSGYNQIKMAVEDREKTSFITPWGTFCYRVMPFGLKNAGATYQRAMTALFHDMMNKELEVYVDDMIVKSRTIEGHFEDLKKLFNILEKYKLCLNP